MAGDLDFKSVKIRGAEVFYLTKSNEDNAEEYTHNHNSVQ